MRANAYQNYFENEILTADPVKLVVLLYRGAVDAIGAARRHLAGGDIRARSRSITQAVEIIAELIQSLDHERGGEVSRNLAMLYDYALARLNEANSKQVDAPLADAERVMAILLEGWEQQSLDRRPAPSAAIGYSPAADAECKRFSCAY